ncbi:MAG: LytR/AlgR family response regulator transcription factor [Bacteroidia bacterium]
MHCLIVDDDILSRKVLKRFVEQTEFITGVAECANAIEANKFLQKQKTDLLFLDVEMPGMTGLELISILRDKPAIVLVSGKREYAVEAFDNDAIDYLVKPVSYARFLKAAQKALQLVESKNQQPGPTQKEALEYLYLKVDSSWKKINVSEIQYVQAMADYVNIYVGQGAQTKRLVIHSTMKGVEKKLNSENFVRIHRSFIVNARNIQSFSVDTVFLADKHLPIGVTYRNTLQKALEQLAK